MVLLTPRGPAAADLVGAFVGHRAGAHQRIGGWTMPAGGAIADAGSYSAGLTELDGMSPPPVSACPPPSRRDRRGPWASAAADDGALRVARLLRTLRSPMALRAEPTALRVEMARLRSGHD